MAHEHGSAPQPLHELLQPREAVQVEVVRGLVEEHDVEAGQQQRGETHPCRLATGQRGHERVRPDTVPVQVVRQPELGEHDR